MDYARRIGRSEESKKWRRQPIPFVTVRDHPISGDGSRECPEDPRLANWKGWLNDRKRQSEKIKSATGREEHAQLINSCERVRDLVETRNLLEIAAATPCGGCALLAGSKLQKDRGDSKFLTGTVMAEPERNVTGDPRLDRVRLPNLTLREKNLARVREQTPLWRCSGYLEARMADLEPEIRRLVPKEPEMDELAVQGHQPRLQAKPIRVPPVTITADDHFEFGQEPSAILRIQEREVRRKEERNQDVRGLEWSLVFSGRLNETVERDIRFENTGTQAILVKWRERPFWLKLGTRPGLSPFYLDRSDVLILPGQIHVMKVWYLPRKFGVSTEIWEILTEPLLSDSPLTVRFWARAETERFLGLESIDRYLDRCIRDSLIREILENILDNIENVEFSEPPYGSLFLPAEIFVSRNPPCFYHPTVLADFQKIYQEVSQNERETEPWNFSLKDLRDCLLKVDQPVRRNDLLTEFNCLYKKCLKPTPKGSKMDDKRQTIYCVLCSLASRLQSEVEFVKSAGVLENWTNMAETKLENDFSKSNFDRSEDGEFRKRTKIDESKLENDFSQSNCGESGDEEFRERISQKVENCLMDNVYKQSAFVRVHELIGLTINRVCAILDSFHRLDCL